MYTDKLNGNLNKHIHLYIPRNICMHLYLRIFARTYMDICICAYIYLIYIWKYIYTHASYFCFICSYFVFSVMRFFFSFQYSLTSILSCLCFLLHIYIYIYIYIYIWNEEIRNNTSGKIYMKMKYEIFLQRKTNFFFFRKFCFS